MMQDKPGIPLASVEKIGELLFFKIPAVFIGTIGLAQIGVNLANVLMRYLFRMPLVWAEEFLALSVVWVVFLGVTMVAWRWEHLSVDLISNRLSPRMRSVFDVAVGISVLVACTIIAVSAYRVVATMMMLNTRSIIMKYPMYYAHASVLIGSVLQIAAVLWRFALASSGVPLAHHASPDQSLPPAAEQRLDSPMP